MAAQQLSDGNPEGVCIGQSSSDLVGFYGKTPVARPATIADATDAATAITKCNEVIAALKAVGIIAAS
jgi:hypothetical protein